MYTIKTLNAISPVGLAKLPKNQFDVTVDADAPDGILVRSADLLNTTFNDNLLAIARAGAGVNNIPLERCSEQGIVVFNTPGANANAVAELVIGMLIAGSRNVAAAAQWCQGLAGDPAMAKSVEKGKKQFVGNEIKGKTLGVIGLGAIGSRVANCAIELGMEVYGYDPYITHSVNLPEVHQPRAGGKRICIIHKNEPGMISQITALTTEAGLNIENMVNKSKKNMAYTMLDATGAVDARLSEKLSSIPAVIRVRIL